MGKSVNAKAGRPPATDDLRPAGQPLAFEEFAVLFSFLNGHHSELHDPSEWVKLEGGDIVIASADVDFIQQLREDPEMRVRRAYKLGLTPEVKPDAF